MESKGICFCWRERERERESEREKREIERRVSVYERGRVCLSA
jgi:hypothetical protein